MKLSLRYALLILVIWAMTSSCSESYNKQNNVNTKSPKVNFLDKPCALFVGLSDKKMHDLKALHGQEGFETVLDDQLWYSFTAREFLDSMHIKCYDTLPGSIWHFKLKNGRIYKLSSTNQDWKLFLFNGIDPPSEAQTINIQQDYEHIFHPVK